MQPTGHVHVISYDEFPYTTTPTTRMLRVILCKIRVILKGRGHGTSVTDLAEILHVVLLWGPNYEMDVSKFW